MVFLYPVDVGALPEIHCRRILDAVNSCSTTRITKLDYSYGVVYQDQGSVLGVALVNRSGNAHTLEKLCVVAGARCKGVGTDILDMVKEQVGSGALCVYAGDQQAFFEKRGFSGDNVMYYVDTTWASGVKLTQEAFTTERSQEIC